MPFSRKSETRSRTLNVREMPYTVFLEKTRSNQITRVVIYSDEGIFVVTDVNSDQYRVKVMPDRDLFNILTEHQIDMAIAPAKILSP